MNNTDFSLQHCEPCHKGTTALTPHESSIWLNALTGWAIDEKNEWLSKAYSFRNFASALEFVRRIGDIAEQEGHHPDINLGWGYAKINIQTHALNGLHRNDFILAAKIDKIQKPA